MSLISSGFKQMTYHSVHLIFVITDIFCRVFGEISALVFVQETSIHGDQNIFNISDNLIS